MSSYEEDFAMIELIDDILWYDDLKWWGKLLVKVKLLKRN
jgi:hypothetical protein